MASFIGYKRSIVLAFNYDEIKQGIPQVNKQMALLNAEYKKTQAEINATGTTMDKSSAKLDYLKEKYKIQTQTVEQHKKKLQELETAETKDQKAIANTTIALKNAEAQLKTTENKIKDATTEVKNQQTALGAAATQWTDFSQSMSDSGVNIDAIAGQMQKVGAAMTGVGVVSAKLYMDFDTAMTKARTIADESQLSFDQMKDGVMELSSTYALSTQDMANGLYQVLSSGVETADSLKILNEAGKLAVTGYTDTSTAVDILTSVMNGYGLSVDEASAQVDQLITTQKLGKLTVGELGSSIGGVISIAANAGVSIADLESGIAAMTLTGLHADEAITGVRAVINAVISPTAEATAEAKKLGIQFNMAAIESKGLAGFMKEVERKTRGNNEAIPLLFGNVRSLNTAFGYTGRNAESFADILDQVENSAGVADEAFKKTSDTVGFQFKKSLNDLSISAQKAGESFAPVITFVTGFIQTLASMPRGVIPAISAIGALLLVVGTVIKTIGTVSMAINSFSGVMSLFNSTAGNATFVTFAKWVGIISAVIALLAIMIALWNITIGKGDEMVQTTEKMASAVTNARSNAATQTQAATRKAYAIGTQYHSGGTALVGEYGPEEVLLPVGSKVKTARETKNSQQSTDNSRMESLLSEVLNRMDRIENGIKEQPYKQQQLSRMGVV